MVAPAFNLQGYLLKSFILWSIYLCFDQVPSALATEYDRYLRKLTPRTACTEEGDGRHHGVCPLHGQGADEAEEASVAAAPLLATLLSTVCGRCKLLRILLLRHPRRRTQ